MPDVVVFLINLGVALVVGTAIGVERQYRQHPAGLRTNALVCVGAALFVSLPRLLDPHEASRVAAQVVSGIGFLGAGVIMREGVNVRGMNTAATLWCSAAVGALAGAGLPGEAALGAGVILLVNVTLRPLARRLDALVQPTGAYETSYQVRVLCTAEHAPVIRSILMRHVNSQPGMRIQGIALHETEEGSRAVVAEIFSHERHDRFLNDLVSRLTLEPTVTDVSWSKGD